MIYFLFFYLCLLFQFPMVLWELWRKRIIWILKNRKLLSSTFRQPDLLGAFRIVNHNLIAHVSNRCGGYCTFASLLTT